MSVTIRRLSGKGRRLKRTKLGHRVSGRGKGKWQSSATLWNYKRKARRKRLIADASRRRNRPTR